MLNCLSVHSFLYPSTLSVSFSLQPGLQLLSSLKSVRFSPLLSLCSFIPDPVLFVIITGHVPLPPLLLWPHSALLSSLIVSGCPTCCPTPSLAWCCHGVDLCCQHEGLQLSHKAMDGTSKQTWIVVFDALLLLSSTNSPNPMLNSVSYRWLTFEQHILPSAPKPHAQIHKITHSQAFQHNAVTWVWWR